MTPHEVDAAAFWQNLYADARDGWELGRPAPPLAAYFAESDAPPPGRAVVPGCGRGHEALLLAARGHEVVGIDFAPTPIAAARAAAERAGLADRARFVEADLFAVAPPWPGGADLVVEHTFYCAIDPARRDAYAARVAALLRPGGLLVGLFWACGRAGGPPFSTEPDELRARFSAHLVIDRLTAAAGSIPTRAGQEWLLVASRPAVQVNELSPLP